MTAALQDNHYKGKNAYKLVTINQCHLYQQVFFISDLLNTEQDTVNKEYLHGTKQHQHREIKFPQMLKSH